MEAIRGKVADLQAESSVTGSFGQHGGGVSTTFVTSFQIGNQFVRLASESTPAIRDGDDLAVAGLVGSDGVLEAEAFRNLTRATSQGSQSEWMLLGSLVFIVIPGIVGFLLLLAFLGSRYKAGYLIGILICGGLVTYGVHSARATRRRRTAVQMLVDVR